MSNLSFGGWGGVSTEARTTPYNILPSPLTITGAGVSNASTFIKTAGPQIITFTRPGFWYSFEITCGKEVQSAAYSNDVPNISNITFTNIATGCTVVPATAITGSLNINCFLVTEVGTGSAYSYTYRFSPYAGIAPTIEVTTGTVPLTGVEIYVIGGPSHKSIMNNIDFVYTNTQLIVGISNQLVRIYGNQLVTIVNPDGTLSWFELYGGPGDYRDTVRSYYIANNPSFRYGCNMVQTVQSGNYLTLQITTTTGYVYDFYLYPSMQIPTVTLDATSVAIGAGNTVQIMFTTFL